MINKNIKTKKHPIKSTNLSIRTKPQIRSLIDQAAAVTNKTVTGFVLDAACREAEEVLFDKKLFTLDKESYKKFIDALDTPVQSNKKLQNLLNRKPLWEQ